MSRTTEIHAARMRLKNSVEMLLKLQNELGEGVTADEVLKRKAALKAYWAQIERDKDTVKADASRRAALQKSRPQKKGGLR
jgi:hypothetical protein